MATITKGTYVFTNNFTLPETEIIQDINYTLTSRFLIDGEKAFAECTRMTTSLHGIFACAISITPPPEETTFPIETPVYYSSSGWLDKGGYAITIAEDATVEQTFADWFNASLVPATILYKGVYRFSDLINEYSTDPYSIEIRFTTPKIYSEPAFVDRGFEVENKIIYTNGIEEYEKITLKSYDTSDYLISYSIDGASETYYDKNDGGWNHLYNVYASAQTANAELAKEHGQKITVLEDTWVSTSFYNWMTNNSSILLNAGWQLNEILSIAPETNHTYAVPFTYVYSNAPIYPVIGQCSQLTLYTTGELSYYLSTYKYEDSSIQAAVTKNVYALGDNGLEWADYAKYGSISFYGTIPFALYKWLLENGTRKNRTVSGTWRLDKELDELSVMEINANINFSCNGLEYSGLSICKSGEAKNGATMVLYGSEPAQLAYIDKQWEKQYLRTIHIPGEQEVSEEFYQWLHNNATVITDVETLVEYNGKIIGTAKVGEVTTLYCEGLTMRDDVLVDVIGQHKNMVKPIGDEQEMKVTLALSPIGSVYTYTGETTEQFENGAFYLVWGDE